MEYYHAWKVSLRRQSLAITRLLRCDSPLLYERMLFSCRGESYVTLKDTKTRTYAMLRCKLWVMFIKQEHKQNHYTWHGTADLYHVEKNVTKSRYISREVEFNTRDQNRINICNYQDTYIYVKLHLGNIRIVLRPITGVRYQIITWCRYILPGPMDGYPCSLQTDKKPPGSKERHRGLNPSPLGTRSEANFVLF
jgi:hypothetical protein